MGIMTEFLSVAGFVRPHIDWHALAPELTLLGVGALLTMLDIGLGDRGRKATSALAGIGLLGVLVPIITLLAAGVVGEPRVLFDGAYVVDGFALLLKGLFAAAGYVVVLMSTNYVEESGYWGNEYYGLMLSSLLGMVVMASARDLISIFVALELLSIPAYLLAAWRKRDLRSNEAGVKYYLMGVFASAIMLYGMSLLFGVTGSTVLADIASATSSGDAPAAAVILAVVFVVVGFAFKVSAFPFHTWAPDVYEGSPTPVTAFLSVASKTAGFVALTALVIVGFWERSDVYAPLLWFLAAASMTGGNLMALRQRNIVRLMAYSGVAQAGFMLAPLAVAGSSALVADEAVSAVLTYLVIYAAMNLGVFAVIMAVARRTRSGEVASYNGLFRTFPAMAVLMTIFLASLAGVPPAGGWYAKFVVFKALVSPDSVWGYVLAVIAGINAVVAVGYYGKLAARMWFEKPWVPEDEDVSAPAMVSASPLDSGEGLLPTEAPVKAEPAASSPVVPSPEVQSSLRSLPFSLRAALTITSLATLVFGILPFTVSTLTLTEISLLSPLPS